MYRRRYRRIVDFFARQLFKLILWDIVFPRIGLREYSQQTRPDRLRSIASSFREMAIEMGGVWIKVGQFLSTRVDVLPPEFTNELAGLQDEVPPADFEEIVVVAESEFGMPLISKYLWFDPKPLAAASLGQVHKAKIYKPSSSNPATLDDDNLQQAQKSKSNESITVVVKVQRPNIEAIINTDLSALKTVGNWLQKYPPLKKRANIPALINEFTRILYEELDYIAEGRNANVFAEQYKSDPQIRIPDVVWSHTTKRVLTLENVWGIKITDYEAISAAGVDRSEVAIQLIDVYLKQIFEDGFFHADPHPGNLFINPIPLMPPISKYFGNGSNKSEVFWQLTFVDFGMVGHVPEYMKRGLRDLLIGVGTKDTPRVIKAYQELDILLPGADTEQIEKAGSDIFDLFWGKNMEELSQISTDEVLELTREYRDLLYSLPLQIPQNLIFLFRTMGILSGICTGLDPEFNIFDHIAPYAQKLIIQEAKIDPSKIISEVGLFAQTLLSLPAKMDNTLKQLESGKIAVKMPEVTKQVRNLEGAIRQVVWGIVFAALLLSSVHLHLGGDETFSMILFSGAVISLALLIISGIRKR